MFAISRVFLCRPILTSTSLLSYSTEAPIRTLLNNSEKAAKALAACKCKRMIKSAARENGPFPEYNSKLAYWIDEAKRCDISDSTIDFSIKLTLVNGEFNYYFSDILFDDCSRILMRNPFLVDIDALPQRFQEPMVLKCDSETKDDFKTMGLDGFWIQAEAAARVIHYKSIWRQDVSCRSLPSVHVRGLDVCSSAKRISRSMIDWSISVQNKRTNMGIHEVTFPGKCFLVAQYEAIDSSVLASKISRTCDDFDATFVPYDSYRHVYYDPEAVIIVDGKVGGQTLDDSDKEKISMFRNVKISYEENNMGKDNIIFRCGASNLHWLKRNLTDMGYTIEEAFVGFAPKSLVKLPTKAVEKVADLLLILGEMEEVDNLYENVE